MRELILHIGTPKTGSSAIQVFLARNRDALLAHSVDYLSIGEIALGTQGKISSGNGAYLSRCLLPPGAPARIANSKPHVEEFLDAIQNSKSEIGLISSELFVDADGQALVDFVSMLSKNDIIARCFYYIRSQVQFLSSAYVQQVKRHGCTELPADYVSRVYPHIQFLKHHTFFRQLCRVFGRHNVICRVYDIASGSPRGIFSAMLAALGIGSDGLEFTVRDVNTGMSNREIAIMLQLNHFHPRMKFSDMVVENALQAGTAASGQTHNFLPAHLADEIENYFATENGRLAQEYFNRTELFPPIMLADQPGEISIDTLTPQDMVAFLGGLLVRFDERIAALEHQLARPLG